MTPLLLLRLGLSIIGIASAIATGVALGDVARYSASLADALTLLVLASVSIACGWCLVALVGLDPTDL